MPKQKPSTGALPPVRISILRKATAQMFFVTALTAASLSLCSFVIARAQMQRQMFSQLSSVVENRKYLLVQHLQADKERIGLLAWQKEIRDVLQGKGSTEVLSEQMFSMVSQGVPVLGMSVYSTDGNTIAATGTPIAAAKSSVLTTYIEAQSSADGMVTYVVYSPIRTPEKEVVGVLGVRYNPAEFLRILFSSPGVGQTEEVLLGAFRGEDIVILTGRAASGPQVPVEVGNFRSALQGNMPIAGALAQSEGVMMGYDYKGKHVLASYAGIPSVNWGLVVKVEHDEAMQGVLTLSFIMVAISALLIVLSAVVAHIFARKLTEPIISLSQTMRKLGPNHWKMQRKLSTGDEVEVLEHVAADMAARLKTVYETMEDEIADRTKKLKEQYIKDRAILQSIDYGVVMTDSKGVITEANTAALDFLQCTKDRCSGRGAAEVLDIQVRHEKKTINHPVLETIKTKKPVRSSPDVRFSILRTDNILIPVLLSCVPLMDESKVIGTVLVFQDATEQRRVDYLKSEFISLASHQLRTPLSSMQWYIELFADEKGMSKTQHEYLTEMKIAAGRMTGLIDALLHAARLETGDITPHAISVNVSSMLADLGEELRAMGKKKGIACKVNVPKKKVLMETDSVLLHVVFKNLFSNAIKYTNKGGEVGVAMKDAATSVEIQVTDSGIGIPKKEQKRLFERLFRASNVRKMDTDGNGLGLYITKMIVDSLGGSVKVQSTENKGTTVIIKLPKTMKKQPKKASETKKKK